MRFSGGREALMGRPSRALGSAPRHPEGGSKSPWGWSPHHPYGERHEDAAAARLAAPAGQALAGEVECDGWSHACTVARRRRPPKGPWVSGVMTQVSPATPWVATRPLPPV